MENTDAEVWENGIQPVGSYTNKRVTGKNKDTATPARWAAAGYNCIAHDGMAAPKLKGDLPEKCN